MRTRLASFLLVALAAGCTNQSSGPAPDPFGRCANFDQERRPLFGDTHVHTVLSLDASTQGTQTTLAQAYDFARGASLGLQPFDSEGNPARTIQLDRPLDWVAISDHAEFLGTVSLCLTPGTPGYDHPSCVQLRDDPERAFFVLNFAVSQTEDQAFAPMVCFDNFEACTAQETDVWAEVVAAAEAAYDRTDDCSFTSFVGYEWSAAPLGANLHRNVIFANESVPIRPTGYFDAPYPELLWGSLQRDCIEGTPGCDVLAIPHNSNLANGRFFEEIAADGEPFGNDLLALQARLEPLIEVYQHKGDSECWPEVGSTDEDCAFEKLPYRSLVSAQQEREVDPEPQDFIRSAMGQGLAHVEAGRPNPYQFGFIASTDTHMGSPGFTSEERFEGHGGAGLSTRVSLPDGLLDPVSFSPGGLAVVWAEENARDSIFRALRRRETYGTSGTRITLRHFGGWGLSDALCGDPEMVSTGYADGVPMGTPLPPRPDGAGAPRFVVNALRDIGSELEPTVGLAHIEIVKGVLNDAGELEVTVTAIASADDPDAGADAMCGVEDAGGAASLCEVWEDPDFDPTRAAFYYARVLEVPTCRWHTFACMEAEIDCDAPDDIPEGFQPCCDERYPRTIRERAWGSPIWYTPAE